MAHKIAPCLWFDGNAEDAAGFYAQTFPDSRIEAINRSPSDYPDGKEGDVLTVEFTVLGMPFLGLNAGPQFRFDEAISSQNLHQRPSRKPTAIGMQSSTMAVRKATVAGVRIGSGFPGKSFRACSWTR